MPWSLQVPRKLPRSGSILTAPGVRTEMSLLRQGTFSLSKPTAQVTEAEAAALTCLAAAQPAWSKTSPAERAALAKEVLDELGKDEWSTAGEWVSKELELQKLGSTEPAVGAASRFVFGSVIKDFCATFIAAAEGKKLPELPEAHDGSRRYTVAMGMALPATTRSSGPSSSPTPRPRAPSRRCSRARPRPSGVAAHRAPAGQ